MKLKKINYLKRPRPLNCLDAMDYIDRIYSKGLINWNVYQRVMVRIRTNMNGSWMFEQKEEIFSEKS